MTVKTRVSKVLSLVIGTLIVFVGLQASYADSSDAGKDEPAVYRLGSICIESPWAFDSLGKKVGAAYMTISVREGHSVRLVSARSPQATRVEFHNILMNDGVMMMSEAETELLSFSADSPLELKPHGLHVMLTGLCNPLTPESELKLAL